MIEVELPDGRIAEFPAEMSRAEIEDVLAKQFPAKSRKDMGFGERMGENYQRRIEKMQQAAQGYVSGEQSMPETLFQQGLQYAQLAPDVAAETMVSGFRALPDFIEMPIRQGASDVYSNIADTSFGRATGNLVGNIASAYQDFAQENPRAARNIGAVGNLGNIALAFTPIKGQSAVARGGKVAGKTLKTAGGATAKAGGLAIKPFLKSGKWAAQKLDEAVDAAAQGVSGTLNRTNLPKGLRDLGDAELLFVKSLADEGVSLDDALGSLRAAQEFKASPSVGVSANVPQMQTQGYLMSRGSSGSRVAAKAIEDIDKVQIPALNKKLIEQATGGKNLTSEQFGSAVSQEAKKLVDTKKMRLKTRAAPHYAKSVGVDKMVPIENDVMKKALGNRLVVNALDDFRADPYTLSKVSDDLADLGIEAGDITNLPYNSTVSLHAARVNLRRASDEAFRSGDNVKYAAVKKAMNQIDDAIESAYPSYKQARRIYSEDAGALKVLMDSPIGKMSTFAEGNFSKIANDLATKDPAYIKKFMRGIGDNQKLRDSIAGAYLNRMREEARNQGRRFSDALFKSEASAERLRSLVGEQRFNQMQKVNKVIDELVKTRSIPSQSITAAAQSVKGGLDVPTSRSDVLMWAKNKISPDLFTMVQRNPQAAARYNELLFTDEGYKLLESLSGKTKMLNPKEAEKIINFFNKNVNMVAETQ